MANMLEDYNDLPYHSMPFPQTQPAYQAALARLYGVQAPDMEQARVLELGCASGGNIIPLAARFPKAHFEGIDLSSRHVADGQSLIQKLKLSNIQIKTANIADHAIEARKYDYIICHGVFSWVPENVQDAIFRICSQGLSDDGLAYISYNIFPGWHQRLSVRDICLQFSDAALPVHARVLQAREILKKYAHSVDGNTPFGAHLNDDIKRSASMSDSHFHGEFLSDHNNPVLFKEFVTRASRQNLKYVCDAAPTKSQLEMIAPEQRKTLSTISGYDRTTLEQAIDFATGRAFRRSILTRSEKVNCKVSSDALETLHLSSPLSMETRKGGVYQFGRGAEKLSTNDPVVGEALSFLSKVYPETRSFNEVFNSANEGASGAEPERLERLKAAMVQLTMAGHVVPSILAMNLANENDDRFALWPLALAQMEAGQTWVSSQLHKPVEMKDSARLVAKMLDGRRTVPELAKTLEKAIETGQISLEARQNTHDQTQTMSKLEELIASAIVEFRQKGLLALQ